MMTAPSQSGGARRGRKRPARGRAPRVRHTHAPPAKFLLCELHVGGCHTRSLFLLDCVAWLKHQEAEHGPPVTTATDQFWDGFRGAVFSPEF